MCQLTALVMNTLVNVLSMPCSYSHPVECRMTVSILTFRGKMTKIKIEGASGFFWVMLLLNEMTFYLIISPGLQVIGLAYDSQLN